MIWKVLANCIIISALSFDVYGFWVDGFRYVIAFNKGGNMPNYVQRGKKICAVCGRVADGAFCAVCGGAALASGKWSVRFRTYEDGVCVNKRLSGFATRAEAEAAYDVYMATHRAGDTNFRRLFERYLSEVRYSLKGATIYNKFRVFQTHILPYFGARDAFSISKRDLIEWRAKLLDTQSLRSSRKLSTKYVNNIRAELCAFYSYLSQTFDVPNVVLNFKPLKRNWEQVREMQFYDFKQFRRFITRMRRAKSARIKNLWVAFFMTLYYSGARVGEVLALKEDDIDFSDGSLYICKSLTRKTLDGAPYKITTPKNKTSIRNISLPKVLLNQLKQYLSWKRACEIGAEFLFGGDAPLASFSYARMLKNYAIIADLPKIRIHDFRHSHASLLINMGANVALVSRRLGHANTQQTLNTYSHMFPNSDREIIRILDKNAML